jgi:hypothetical protein
VVEGFLGSVGLTVAADSGAEFVELAPSSRLSSAARRPAMGKSCVSLLKVNVSCRSKWIANVGIRRTASEVSAASHG